MKIERTLFILVLFFLSVFVTATDTPVDSLKIALNKLPEDTNRVNTLVELSRIYFNSDPVEAIRYGTMARDLSEKLNFPRGLANSLKRIGMGYYRQGKFIEALDFWNQSIRAFEAYGDKIGESNMLSNIGAVYFDQTENEKALQYYLSSLKVAEEIGDKLRIATALSNIGAVYEDKSPTYDKALEYFQRALPLGESLYAQHNPDGKSLLGSTLTNLGEIYYRKKQYKLALPYYEKALLVSKGEESEPYVLNDIGKLYTERDDFSPAPDKKTDFETAIRYHEQALDIAKNMDSKLDMTQSLLGIAMAHQNHGDLKLALEAFHQAESISQSISAHKERLEAYNGLAQSYAKLNDFPSAYKYQTLYTEIKDTIYNIESEKKLGAMEFKDNLQKKEGQIGLLNKDKERQRVIKNVTLAGLSVVMMFLIVVFFQKKRITKEKKRSDELLLNILPEETAEELKATGSAKAKSIDLVTVMFTDFKNFTQASEKLSPEELVEEINHCYSAFDKIITQYGIEKIKTIGDSYMCAGGLPVPNSTNPVDVVKAGLDMQEFMMKHKQERIAKDQPFFELRLGIHTGPVVAGIVGIKKFAYDIWGDTVNTASRMESSGQVGKVNISGTTYGLVKDHFNCTHRGKIEAKNKGEIDMYFVEGIRA